jgi:hypothetical protein
MPLDDARHRRHPPRVLRSLASTRLALLPLLAALPALAACSSSPTALSIDITTGQETNAITEAGVTSLTVKVTSPIDSTLQVSRTGSPTSTFDFGEIPESEYISVEVDGFNAQKQQVMVGYSLQGLLLSAVAGDISVFVQERLNWARPPGGLECSHVNGVATVRETSSFVLTNGTNATSTPGCDPTDIDVYDLFALTGDQSAPMLGLVPTTMVSLLASDNSSDPQVLAIDSTGGVFWDYDTLTENTGCPPGFTDWADVSGGAAILDTDDDSGTWYVVGATRTTGEPTDVVLEVGADCTTSEIQMNTARKGAAAAWVPNVGLVVAGGSANPNSVGVEVLLAGQNTFTASDAPADATTGAAILPYGTSGILLVGGVIDGMAQGLRQIDPTCDSTTSCMPTPHTAALPSSAPLPLLTQATAYTIATGHGLIIGTDSTGMNRTFTLDVSGDATKPFPAVEVPLREPRRGAVSLASPTGGIALLGGEHPDGTPALSVELFQP